MCRGIASRISECKPQPWPVPFVLKSTVMPHKYAFELESFDMWHSKRVFCWISYKRKWNTVKNKKICLIWPLQMVDGKIYVRALFNIITWCIRWRPIFWGPFASIWNGKKMSSIEYLRCYVWGIWGIDLLIILHEMLMRPSKRPTTSFGG